MSLCEVNLVFCGYFAFLKSMKMRKKPQRRVGGKNLFEIKGC